VTHRMRLNEVLRLNRADAVRAATLFGRPPGRLTRLSFLLSPPGLCAALHRLAHWLWQRELRRCARGLAGVNHLLHKAAIHPACRIGAGLYIPHTAGVVFRGHAGRDLTLFARAVVDAGAAHAASPRLGDGVTIGAGAVVLGAVQVGSGAKLAPLAVLRTDAAGLTAVLSPSFTARSP